MFCYGDKGVCGFLVIMLVPCGIHILPDKYRPKNLVQASPQDSVEYLWCSLYICSVLFLMLAYSRDVLLWVLESVSLSCFFALVYMVVSKCDVRWLMSQELVSPFVCFQSAWERWSEENEWKDKTMWNWSFRWGQHTFLEFTLRARCPDRFQFQQYFYSNRKRQSCVHCHPQTSLWRLKCEHTPTVCRESLLLVECRWHPK